MVLEHQAKTSNQPPIFCLEASDMAFCVYTPFGAVMSFLLAGAAVLAIYHLLLRAKWSFRVGNGDHDQ